MSMPTQPSGRDNPYFTEAENAAEMARLVIQDRLVTKFTGGIFPEAIDLSNIHDILDVACGPGGWVLEVAQTYPDKRVVGVDISNTMIEYARSMARSRNRENAAFKVMDVLKGLDFPDASFALINARFISSFMPKEAWSLFLQECWRLLRPGGRVRITESEWNITNSPAVEKITGLFSRAMMLAGKSFSPDGRNPGVTPVLRRLISQAGFQDVGHRATVIDSSYGTDAYQDFYQNGMIFLNLIRGLVVGMGLITNEEFEAAYQRALVEMQQEDYCSIAYYLTVWGSKSKF